MHTQPRFDAFLMSLNDKVFSFLTTIIENCVHFFYRKYLLCLRDMHLFDTLQKEINKYYQRKRVSYLFDLKHDVVFRLSNEAF